MSGSSFSDHFSAMAADYARFRPRYPAALFAYLAEIVRAHERVWDCGAGSGQASRALAQHFVQVIATDASAEQIAAAEPHAGIEFRVAPAEASGLEAASIDLVTVAQALHWFDFDAFYREVRRVLRPGGALAVWSYGVMQVEGEAVDALLLRFYRETVGPYWPPERRLVEERYVNVPFPFEELSPPAFELERQLKFEQLCGYLRSWSATGRFVAQRGFDPVVELEEQLGPLWGDARRERRIRWPLTLRVGRAP